MFRFPSSSRSQEIPRACLGVAMFCLTNFAFSLAFSGSLAKLVLKLNGASISFM